ncbi:hypothetical protein Acsp04_01190 [Actinomadura sp. NBRC 104425]|nr:hypothetical protein Acsp04_01190 [Actinomadura sp. NBRC 104425]
MRLRRRRGNVIGEVGQWYCYASVVSNVPRPLVPFRNFCMRLSHAVETFPQRRRMKGGYAWFTPDEWRWSPHPPHPEFDEVVRMDHRSWLRVWWDDDVRRRPWTL